MTITIPVTLPSGVREQSLQAKCASAMKLAFNTCVAEGLISDLPEQVYVRLTVVQDMPWHKCLEIGASSRFNWNPGSVDLAEGNKLEHLDAIDTVANHWEKFIRVIVAALVVAADERNMHTKKPEKLQLQVGVYMHVNTKRGFIQRFVEIDLTKYGVEIAVE